MGKKAIGIVVVVIILVVGGIALAMHHKSNNSMSTMNMSSSSSSSSGSTPSATNAVTIDNFAFSPADITVKAGTTVTWTNKDSVTHTVTENDGKTGPNSGDLASGKSYSFTYASAGTFKYHCSIHAEMLGTVTVTQ
jgi:plastocyanin